MIFGALGTAPRDLHKGLKEVEVETKIGELQKAVILNSARVLMKVFEYRGDLVSPNLKD